MSYNRWMPVQCSSELYHHGVKGMKWGKHLFGNGADIQAGAGGGGGGNEEDLKLLEELKKKYGDKALEMFKKIKQQQQSEDGRYGTLDKLREKITGNADPDNIKQVHDRVYERTLKGAKATKYSGAKSETDEEYASRSAKETAEATKKYIKDHSVAGAVNKGKDKIKSILGKHKREKAEERRQESAHDRETRKRDKRERDKLVEELKELNHNRPDWNSKGSQNAQKNPHPNLPRSRKRNVTGKGTGVHIGQTVLPPEPKPLTLISDTNRPTSRKRKVTGKGTGVHVHGPGLNGGRKR